MSEQVRYRTKDMQRVEAIEGRPLDQVLRELYVEQELSLAEIGERWSLTESAISYWLKWAGIEARRGGPRREAATA